MEKGLPRGVAVGLGDGNNPNVQNNNCCDSSGLPTETAASAADGVHNKQRLDGGDSNKSTGGGARARRVVCTAVKVIVAAAAFTVTCAFVWYTMGLPFLLQVAAVACIAFIASGGYKFIYLLYRTAPRDLRSV